MLGASNDLWPRIVFALCGCFDIIVTIIPRQLLRVHHLFLLTVDDRGCGFGRALLPRLHLVRLDQGELTSGVVGCLAIFLVAINGGRPCSVRVAIDDGYREPVSVLEGRRTRGCFILVNGLYEAVGCALEDAVLVEETRLDHIG